MYVLIYIADKTLTKSKTSENSMNLFPFPHKYFCMEKCVIADMMMYSA